jgi:hypothetical protein
MVAQAITITQSFRWALGLVVYVNKHNVVFLKCLML